MARCHGAAQGHLRAAALEGARLTARRVAREIGNALESPAVHVEPVVHGNGREHRAAVLRDAARIGDSLARLLLIEHLTPTLLARQEVLDLDGTGR